MYICVCVRPPKHHTYSYIYTHIYIFFKKHCQGMVQVFVYKPNEAEWQAPQFYPDTPEAFYPV
jgi:hypothetical protein